MNPKALLAAMAIVALPTTSQAQSMFDNTMPTYPGFYIGAEGGLNWLLNNNSYIMNTGWAAGGKVGYDFVGPRVEVEALYHSNYGSGVRAFPNGYAHDQRPNPAGLAVGQRSVRFFPWSGGDALHRRRPRRRLAGRQHSGVQSL